MPKNQPPPNINIIKHYRLVPHIIPDIGEQYKSAIYYPEYYISGIYQDRR
jgi:hypothetical protein